MAPEFNLQGIQATTNPVAVWLIVNGPMAERLGVNSGPNCLGQGAWANATLGRALRLVMQNIGGAYPGDMDRATHGQPGKVSLCCGENEAESPWEQSKMAASRMADKDFERTRRTRRGELGDISPQTLLPITADPSRIGIIVAGGPGTHSVYVPGFGNSRSVSRRIADR